MYFQEFIYTAAMVFFYFTAIIAQFADLYDFDSSEYLHRYDAQIVAGVSTLPDYFFFVHVLFSGPGGSCASVLEA